MLVLVANEYDYDDEYWEIFFWFVIKLRFFFCLFVWKSIAIRDVSLFIQYRNNNLLQST